MSVSTDAKKIEELLTRGVDEVIVKEHLEKMLQSGKQLRIKFGIDPTSPQMHLGHTVPLRKLRQFQDAGHQAVLIIGDATAMIGDPTGRTEARKKLTREEIDRNKETYIEQAGKILDLNTLEIRHNSEWFDEMGAAGFLELTSLVTVQQLLQRDDFRLRVDDPENPLSALEMAYPIMQGYDSVMVKADVELGGYDQKLNLLMGRRMQRRFEMEEQDILTVPLLLGTDGTRKMSKSFGNSISLQETPDDMFAKTMSIPDTLIVNYFTLLTNVPVDEIAKISKALAGEEVNPRDVKARVAWEITKAFYSPKEADHAQEQFNKLHQKHETPENVSEVSVKVPMKIVDLLVEIRLATSKSDARRLIEGGGVKVDGVVVEDSEMVVAPTMAGVLIQKGKRFFVRVICGH
jgi:tyrosyl-tRNA synthetase